MRVLVTGLGGYIGRSVLHPLRSLGFEVHGVGRHPLIVSGAVWHSADLLDASDRVRVVDVVQPTHVLHLAWITQHDLYWSHCENKHWLTATLHLCEAAARHRLIRFVLAGSCAQYDWRLNGPFREVDSGGAPQSLYGRLKLATETALLQFGRRAGIQAACGRLFFSYGPHEHKRRFVPSLALSLLRGAEARCGSGRQIRDFLHVSDIGEALAALVASDITGPINIGSGAPVPLSELARQLGEAAGRPDLIRLGAIPDRPGDPPALVPDLTLMREKLGFQPQIDHQGGLRQTLSWWSNNYTSDNLRRS